tara:strand:- start:5734 stop:6003 length:270 start_codon:yes stop_codon:yes gene_type:complete
MTHYILINGIIKDKMRDTVELAVDRGQEPTEVWFGHYLISVRFNSMLLGFDADIYRSDNSGQLHFVTTMGGKTQGIALQRAKDIVVDRV